MSCAKSSYEHQHLPDPEAMKRSLECKEMLNLQTAQLDQKARFLRYQAALISDLREQCDRAKARTRTDWDRLIAERFDKKERAVEELEARQLEEELKIQKEHDMEKRAVMVRLRHMEAYCRNPTPPPTPIDAVSGRPSSDSSLPERKVTDKDYHSLAQQYRERDAMDTLHMSKINVLRGKQKKAVENLMNKKELEINQLELELQKELDAVEKEFSNQQSSVTLILGQKRARLEARWRTQALIERTKVEKATGLQYAPLPDIVVIDELEQAADPL
ncbi:uncharacterized protein A1O9_05948 [Exophiala aquamarina CBS 119918]|uniref:Uncharacterized protein n=1 Tax=Exophiala aquamarina CBS 119918 TaxID=1182545 RepID=A0A072PR63_9EURO|nr:uncharacterized protein A1O9_05948 [Exophiala aquamarina CBS 119918]KEF58025.1 hypothetical protein A1O9_05948 [Exophiala aquamarina CBS 119918]